VTLRLGYLLLAIGINAAVALAALWRRAVSRDGAVAGFLAGAVILYVGGFFSWAMLMLFFVSSTVVSRIGGSVKRGLAAIHEKTDQRDAVQVLANSLVGAVAVVLFGLTRQPAYAVAAAAAFAAVNADTWASELGVLSSAPARSILTRQVVTTGASGGVTRAGTLASIGGAALIGLWFMLGIWVEQTAASGAAPAGAISGGFRIHPLLGLLFVTAAGALGSVADSVLGATIQAQYKTPEGSFTERAHSGATPNELVRGFHAVNNDAVNFLSSLVAAAVAGGLAALVA
jgi:uncharacterized protein (TIGR00297 family)